MGKTCGFLGNDYGICRPEGIKDRIAEQIRILATQHNVDTFLVGEKGSYEWDTYHTVIRLKKTEFPYIRIVLMMTSVQDLNNHQEEIDDFFFPPDVEHGKRWCIVRRNNWIAKKADFIIAYNRYHGRAYGFCRRAKRRGATIIGLADIMQE
ncbi:MAG: hypothetical protein J6N45_07825 [Alphaproteobacteria bacterium]|nr:hypothetical protein [Alphaproteobacteria bacterium]